MTDQIQARLYDGWRRSAGAFWFGLTGAEFAIALVPFTLLIFSFGWFRFAFYPALLLVIVVWLGLLRVEGVPLWTHFHREIAMLVSRNEVYLTPVLSGGRSEKLPGLMSPTETYEIDPPGATPSYGVVWNRRTKKATVTILGHSQSPTLTDQAELDNWVGGWNEFLAGLGDVMGLDHVTVTVTTATEPGAEVADHITSTLSSDAPDLATRIVTELRDREQQGTTTSQTSVAITFDTWYLVGSRRENTNRRLEAVNDEIMPLLRQISFCGLSGCRLATSHELAAIVRGAFTPSLRGSLQDALKSEAANELLVWDIAGPSSAESTRHHYEHDAALTMGWVLADLPRRPVQASVLSRFLEPGRYPKRVSLIWTPTPTHQAAKILETERTKTRIRTLVKRRSQMDETARDELDRERSDAAAQAEARGAGYGELTFVVTTTLEVPSSLDPDTREHLLNSAEREIDSRGRGSSILLRPATGWHDVALMTSVGAGITPTNLPRWR